MSGRAVRLQAVAAGRPDANGAEPPMDEAAADVDRGLWLAELLRLVDVHRSTPLSGQNWTADAIHRHALAAGLHWQERAK